MAKNKLFRIRRVKDGLYSNGYYGSNKPAFDENGRVFLSEVDLNKFINTIYKLNSGKNMFKGCVLEVYENTSEYSLD